MTDGTEIKYNPKKESLTIGQDLNGDGKPDITLKLRLGVIIRKYGKHIGGAGLILGALAAAHALGLI